jgi:hypothetical protein
MSIFDHLTETEINRLPTSQMAWGGFIADGDYVEKQEGRFEPVGDNDEPLDARWENGGVAWLSGIASALLYLAHVRSTGAEAVLLFDLASLPEEPLDYPSAEGNEYAVVTLGYKYHEQMLEDFKRSRENRHPRYTEVWAAWNALPDVHPSPVKTIARDLGMGLQEVADIVFPAPTFTWEPDDEPDLMPSIVIPDDASVLDGNRRLTEDGETPEGMWSGWEFDADNNGWITHLQADHHGAVGWVSMAFIEPMDDDRFGIRVEAIYVLKHIHGVPADEQPHSVHETFSYIVGAMPGVGDALQAAQRFATTWATVTMETFDIVAKSSPKLIARRAPALREQVMQRMHEILDDES